ncbi:unnamed protein product [Periconia digitata]|uniref:Uncharacterized protein n=1 Tax=Periconia digitata TaxID=1303443 RepID=A0A9W4XF35_9PLEO|nr:unnamed protein product [Periconia digitata]
MKRYLSIQKKNSPPLLLTITSKKEKVILVTPHTHTYAHQSTFELSDSNSGSWLGR